VGDGEGEGEGEGEREWERGARKGGMMLSFLIRVVGKDFGFGI
jgi:hypothetical protein